MQVAAIMPWFWICHEEVRKQASIVYQFHSILILQSALLPLLSMSIMVVVGSFAVVWVGWRGRVSQRLDNSKRKQIEGIHAT